MHASLNYIILGLYVVLLGSTRWSHTHLSVDLYVCFLGKISSGNTVQSFSLQSLQKMSFSSTLRVSAVRYECSRLSCTFEYVKFRLFST
jgi:hypothetical protein